MEIQPQGLFTENVDLTQQLTNLYPASTYGKRRDVTLHYLIALDQPFAQYINPARLSKADPQNGLTPFHVAAMKGDSARAEFLIKVCENPAQMINTQDHLGWTPLHFAAVTSHELFQRFLTLGGDPTIKTNNGANCDDLLKLTGRIRDIRPSLTESVALFPKEFILTDSPLYPKEKFHKLYLNDEIDEYASFKDTTSKLYEAFRANPPMLFIDQCEEMKEVSPHSLDCKAKEKIISGSIIAEYAGLIDDSPGTQSFIKRFSEEAILQDEYLLGNINARTAGNESRFFNTGFPNAVSIPVILRGVKRGLIVAIRDIEPGESIRWDYGMQMFFLTFGRCLLLGKEEMTSFFQKNSETFFNSAQEAFTNCRTNTTLENFMTLASYEARAHYVLNCPTALLYLHFHNIVPLSVWKKGIEDKKTMLFNSWLNKFSSGEGFLLSIFDTLDKIEKICGTAEVKAAVYEWARLKLEKQTVIHILKSLDLLKNTKFNTVEKLNPRLQEIDQTLSNYDWQKDLEKYPFNMQRLAQLVLDQNKKRGISKKDIKSALEESLNTLDKESDSYKINSLMLKKLG